LIGLDAAGLAIELDGAAGFPVIDVAHELDDVVFVMPVAVAGGIDGVVGDLDAEEVGEGFRPGESALTRGIEDGLRFGVGGGGTGSWGWAILNALLETARWR